MNEKQIAIVGIGCRFPGGINDPESFWKLLVEGREAVTDIPSDRWNIDRFYDAEPGLAGKSIAKRGGFVSGIDQFDPQFFGISLREAPFVDPLHRLLLETTWEAIEDAGVVLDLEKGTDIGVFVGLSHSDYQTIQDRAGIGAHTSTGTAHSIAANRISYCLNLRGPSLALDTACSSALTAVHLACEHINSGRCRAAVAGGVTVLISPDGFIGFSQAGMLSPDGKCKAFDASANGFVRSEGAGMILMKPLSDAVADGDPIYAVIAASAVNQDGHTNGISLPSTEAQARLVREACANAGIDPAQIGYVEAHGTGTAVGDPIEAHALAEALCTGRTAETALVIGSAKTNLGHLETAAGVAGLIKAALVLKHGTIPPNLHFETPNPNIDFAKLKLRVPLVSEPFPKTDGIRMAGINSFGFGGANAHVILAEAPARPLAASVVPTTDRAWPIVLSARSEESLRVSARQLGAWLDEQAKLNGNSIPPQLPDLTYSLGGRRNHHSHRLTATVRSVSELSRELDAFSQGQARPKLRTAFTPRLEKAVRVAFIMSGQGPQWWGMGRELMQHEPVFSEVMEACDKAMKPWARFSLLEELARTQEDSQMHRTEIVQPAIFAMQVALAELWKSWGVQPVAIMGHSTGEVAAACAAGVLSLEEAARVIVLRSIFMEDRAPTGGSMLAVGMGADEANAVIARHDSRVSIAAFNGPRSLTLAGLKTSLERIAAELDSRDIFCRFLQVASPFHHEMMQPAADAIEEALADLEPRAETVPFFSSVSGGRFSGEGCKGAHWASGVRDTVEFVSAVNAVTEFGVDVWLEIGSHPALVRSIQECLAEQGSKGTVVASTRREREHEAFLETALDLHLAGVALDFKAATPSRRLLNLPAYPWDKSRCWNEGHDLREGRLAPGGRGLLDVRLSRATPTWTARLDGRQMAFLKDHRVENLIVFPAAGFVEMVLEAGAQWFEGKPFAVEDFEIRKPLILPDPASGLLLELTFEPNERTFAIQSRFENGGSWSVHVVGSMRGERVESAFATSNWEATAGLEPLEVDTFYGRMSDLGLPYGEEFRPIRELSAGAGKSAGRLSLTEAAARRAGEYSLHPALFDGALQIFSAGAATLEGQNAGLRLPVRFSRILFLRSPGAAGLVRAGVTQANDEFIEGGLDLFDAAGQPCVRIDGFRVISVEGARRSGKTGKGRDLVYHVGWDRTAAPTTRARLAPLPLDRLRNVAQQALDEVFEMRGREALRSASASGDQLAAAQIARVLCEMGARPNETFTAEALSVTAAMHPAFAQLMDGLVQNDLLVAEGVGYRPTSAFTATADGAAEVFRNAISKYPGHLPDALLVAASAAQLGAVLRGEKNAAQVLSNGDGPEQLEQFFGDGLRSSPWHAAVGAAVKEAASHLPEGRGLRILEIVAGTGGLASQVLPLLERGLHSYILSDATDASFAGARQNLAGYPEVEYKTFNLDQPGAEQDFAAGNFDLIIGADVLHLASDPRFALRNLQDLLTPGGSLFLVEMAKPHLWWNAVFGLTSTAQRLSRDAWTKTLRDSGFAETASLSGLGDESLVGLMARKSWIEPEAFAPSATAEPLTENSWLVLADEAGTGDRLAQQIRATGARCRVAHRGGAFASEGEDAYVLRAEEPQDWTQLLAACAQDSPQRLVFLWSLDEREQGVGSFSVDALLHLTQALGATAKLRLDLVTRGAQPVGREHAVAVQQAPVVGMLRVMANEYPNLTCRGIDLPTSVSKTDDVLLWEELLQKDSESEIAFRGEARYVRRIGRGLPRREEVLDPSVPLRIESLERGLLSSLRLVPFALPECGPGQVTIEVKAAGMNFRDVLKALALYPAETADARIYGDEVAGVVKAVGHGVTQVAVGDRVFGLAVFGLATHAMARGGDVRRIPTGLSFEEAATLPVVFMTSWHALKTVAHLQAGERVLVHAGAGGVGMAAIQIAHHLGAEVIASAGSPAKRALLEVLGVKHVIDSRRGDFVESVMEITSGKGVDVVLNALAAEAIPMGLSCLAPFGRFVEIGKRDIYQNSRIPLWPMRRNASFHVVAMDAIFTGDEEQARQLLGTITDLVAEDALRPLQFRAFPAARIDAAFRWMAQGKHTGKVVVAFPEPFVARRGEPLAPGFVVKPDGSYLITGAFGGFGKVLAEWLVDRGARHLVLTSRNGPTTPEAEEFLTKLRGRGVEVQVVQANSGSADDVKRLLAEISSAGHPLKGVFHLAMVIDDAPLASLTRERMRTVLAPKAQGAWLLHEGTLGLELDCFVMFSSVSSVFGSTAQGNYAAANAFLDALAHHRQALGLPGLAINWGALGGEGYVARNERVAEYLARLGLTPLTPNELTVLLESFLSAGAAQAMALRVDWSKWRQAFRGTQESPLLEHIAAATVDGVDASGAKGDWARKIENASLEEREGVIGQAVREVVGSVLRVKPETLRDDQPLADLGLDSLMAVEIENSLEAAVGVALPPASLMRARTIGQIATLLAEFVGGHASANAPAAAGPTARSEAVETEHAEGVDLEALSDEEIDRLLEGEIEDPAPEVRA
ncbi:MAG: SDR family NAD(P)-dependent oxidoreductase [Chthoniobacterales bacterium]